MITVTHPKAATLERGSLKRDASIQSEDERLKTTTVPVLDPTSGCDRGKTVIIPFDYDDVIAGKNLETNILLRRGDVIFVP